MVCGAFLRGLSKPGVISLACVAFGIVLFGICIDFSLPWRELRVNDDDLGGTATDPCVWSAGSVPKRRKVREGVRNFAMLPGPLSLWAGDSVQVTLLCGLIL